MAARKKAEPKAVEVETAPEPETQSDESVVEETKTTDGTEDIGGLRALQARFDGITKKGFTGPEKEN
jgi:hypothetical protein